MKRYFNERWAQNTEKLLKCIRSCETIAQLDVCSIMYARLIKTAQPRPSEIGHFAKSMHSLLITWEDRRKEIIQTVPNAIQVSLLPRYKNNAKV